MSRRAGIDTNVIVQAAAELVDTEGIEQLTLAQLAEKLGIRTPSLYNHISSLADLRSNLALFCVRELLGRVQRAAIGKSKDEAIIAIAQAYRTYALEHPGRYAFTLHAPAEDNRELLAVSQELVDVLLLVLAGYQLYADDALHAVRVLRSGMHGFVSLELAGGFGLPLDLDESFRRLLNVFLHGLKQR